MKFIIAMVALTSVNVFGQASVNWLSEKEAPKFISVSTPSIFGGKDGEFVVRSDNNRLNPEVVYEFNKGRESLMTLEEKYGFSQIVEPSNFAFIGNNLVRIEVKKGEGEIEYYLSAYDIESNEVHSSVELGSISDTKENKNSSLSFIQSKNRNFLMTHWIIGDSKETDKSIWGYSIIDSNLTITKTGVFTLPFEGGSVGLKKFYVSDSGEPFAIIKKTISKGASVYCNERMDRVHGNASDRWFISEVSKTDNKLFELKVEDKLIFDLELDASVDGINVVALFGVQGLKVLHGYAQGVANFKVNFTTNENSREIFTFSDEILRKNSTLDEKLPNSEDTNIIGIKELSLDKVIALPDDGFLVLLEHKNLFPNSYGSSPNGKPYVARNILTFKFDSHGGIIWEAEIEKRQNCTFIDFSKVSCSSFIRNNQVHFLFNDISTNYNEAGDYVGKDNPNWAKLFGRTKGEGEIVLVIASVSIESGEIQRKVLDSNSDSQFLAMPASFFAESEGDVILYSVGNRNKSVRLGTITWK